jgi:tetratricopeptide (TPR) repeat protein
MIKYILLIYLCLSCSLEAQKFIHPGVLHTDERIEYMRIMVQEKVEPAYGSFLLLKENPCAQADYKMQGPFRVISRDGAFGYTKSKMESDFSAAYLNSLMWMLTRDKAHAEKSLEILSLYADSLQMIPATNDSPLLAGLEGFKIIYSLEILKHTYTPVSKKKIRKIEQMFKRLFIPIMERFYATPPYTNGNWGPVICKTYMAAGICFNDRKMYDFAKDFYLHAHDNGTIENYIDGETGQTQESGRDQGHPQLALGAMATVCELAWQQGDDLYSALNNRLLKGYEYVARYNLGQDVPFKQWTDITGKYCDWETISEKSRGSFRPIYEIAYNHFNRRKGFPMPYTLEVLKKIRPEGFERDEPAFGSLLFND